MAGQGKARLGKAGLGMARQGKARQGKVIKMEARNMVNMRDMAKKITLQEGLKESISIAQVAEVLRLYNNELTSLWNSEEGKKEINNLFCKLQKNSFHK